MTDKTVAELMAQIDARCMWFNKDGRAVVEQAIRRAVDWGEPVGYIDEKDVSRLSNYKATIWPGTNEIAAVPLYARNKP